MLDRRDSALKSFAANIARSLAGGQEALEILRGLGLLAETPDGASNPVPKPGWVGIWEPRTEDGNVSYQRAREQAGEWTSWADVERIPPKGPRQRVVLIGESVARGYFYPPHLTPARVLEALLGVAGIPGGAEVVDLAKNDLDGLALGALVNASLALQPDAIVLFAGNNWAQVSALVRDWRFGGMMDPPWLPGSANERWLYCFREADQALREERIEEAEARAQGGIRRVDLPRVFERQLGGDLPDRRLFLDYCHLTSEGIRLAMAAVAVSLTPVRGGREPDAGELARVPEDLDPDIEGEARFAAAIHNAHWGQPWDIVHHHCAQAIAASRRTTDLMREYAELQARHTPAWMCAAGERLAQQVGAGPLRRYLHIYMVYGQGKFLDRLLLDAVATALEEAGISARERLEEPRHSESGLEPARPADLLDQYYRPTWVNRDWIPGRNHYYRAHAPQSEFAFVCKAPSTVELRVICRRPEGAPPDEPCGLAINGTRIGEIDATADWRSFRVTLESDLLHADVNSVEIHWPWRTRAGEEGLEQAARDLEAGLPYELLPIFGEIHSLTAWVAG